MRPKRWALSVLPKGIPLTEHAEVARESERLGYTDAWSLEVGGVGGFAPLAVVGQTTHLRLGTGIVNVILEPPGIPGGSGIARYVQRR
ncbi:hypothetical protein NKDENANG_00752 [Candidatus Entotheonellaceae bacterium PAL068K]